MMSLFGRKKKSHDAAPNSIAWMVSYADMATILLAMFIVLSTFAKDQTGITLYTGTGSFNKAMKNFGLPGIMPNSARTVPLNYPGPAHSFYAPAEWKKNGELSPDVPRRVIDSEEERFQYFLTQIGNAVPLEKLAKTTGQVAYDFHEPLASKPPYLTQAHRSTVTQLVGLLRRKNFQVQIIVWAGLPKESAMLRVSNEANAIVEDLAAGAALTKSERARLLGVGQSWRYRDERRPVLSVVVTANDSK